MNLAKKASSVLGRDFFLLFTNLATSVVIARTLGPEVMGIWVILNTIPSYAEMFGRTKVDLAAVYFLGKGKYQIGDVSFALNTIAIITSVLIISLITLFFGTLSTALLKEEAGLYSSFLILMLAAIPLNLIYLNYMYLHIYNENASAINLMILARALTMSGSAITGLLFFDFSIPELVICFIMSYAIGLYVGINNSGYQKRTGPIFNLDLVKDLFGYAYKIYVSGLLISLNSYIANTFIVVLGVPSQITFYALAQQFAQILLKVINSLNTFIFPIATKKNNDDSKVFVAKAFRVATVIMVPLGFISSVGILPAIYLFYGAEYIPIVVPFLILLPGIVCSSIAGTVLQYFMSSGSPEIITKTLVIPVALQLILGFLIIPIYGINGAAGILSFGMIVASVTQVILFVKKANLNFAGSMVGGKDELSIVLKFVKSALKL